MFYFGIDWGEVHLDLCIINEIGGRVSQLVFEPTVSGFERIEAQRIKLNVPASECPVAIETASNLVVDYLLDRGYPVYIVPPQATKAYRNRHHSSQAHTDRSDAALLASILRTDRESHRRWQPNSPLTQQMLAQVRLIETLRRSIQRQSNQLRAALLRTFPAALELFGDLSTQIALHFLSAYPTAAEASELSREAFETFCRDHGDTRRDLRATRYARLTKQRPIAHPAVVQAYREPIRVLAEVLLLQVRSRSQALKQLGALFEQHPDVSIFASLPGAGELLAPALLVKFGDRRERFPRPADVQALAGTCPVTLASGKKQRILFRKGCDKEFRRIAQHFARASRKDSTWATAYWEELRARGASEAHADRALANRWLAIIWKLWQSGTPYDEALHLKQRAKRARPKA